MDALVNQLVDFIVSELKKTSLNREFDLSAAKTKITEIVSDVILKLDTKDSNKILKFLRNGSLFKECIVPNISKILSDGKLNLEDIPYFLEILYGIYSNINQFIRENPTVTISSNDMIELGGLLLKTTLTLLVTNPAEINLGLALINGSIKFVKFTVSDKTKSCKLFCCCGGKSTST